ncbi:cation:proton antiporter [Streptomyces asiaticus]|uniref:cation:proton antiporter n=1 Tax=Streptomyces asiaticus TaxID=114695 RepID=UPI0039BE330A
MLTTHQVQWLFLGLVAVLVLGTLFGAGARLLRQPAVVGEILAGILIGPSLFGGALADFLFPADTRPLLAAFANVGLALFMFVIGYELPFDELRDKARVALRISLCSVAVPFVLGVLLALYLVRDHHVHSQTGFVLFLGAAMSVTAFPVLARILTDYGLDRTRLGGIALAGAGIGDVLAWLLLGLVVTVNGGTGQERLLLVPLGLIAMVTLVRPLLRRAFTAVEGSGGTGGPLVAVMAGLMLSCWAAEWVGIHFIFGAFLFGTVTPRTERADAKSELTGHIESISGVLLLPVYFVLSGLRVDLSGIGFAGLGELVLILLVALAGKFLGAFAGARLSGIPMLQATALAALMNTRGLTEIVLLTAGLELGVIDASFYSLMILMALVTTAMTGPMLRFLERRAGGDARQLGEFEYERQGFRGYVAG